MRGLFSKHPQHAQVDFEGRYPIEGAKEVKTLMTRYVTRAVRMWVAKLEEEASMGTSKEGGLQALHMAVSESRNALDIVPRDQG